MLKLYATKKKVLEGYQFVIATPSHPTLTHATRVASVKSKFGFENTIYELNDNIAICAGAYPFGTHFATHDEYEKLSAIYFENGVEKGSNEVLAEFLEAVIDRVTTENVNESEDI